MCIVSFRAFRDLQSQKSKLITKLLEFGAPSKNHHIPIPLIFSLKFMPTKNIPFSSLSQYQLYGNKTIPIIFSINGIHFEYLRDYCQFNITPISDESALTHFSKSHFWTLWDHIESKFYNGISWNCGQLVIEVVELPFFELVRCSVDVCSQIVRFVYLFRFNQHFWTCTFH